MLGPCLVKDSTGAEDGTVEVVSFSTVVCCISAVAPTTTHRGASCGSQVGSGFGTTKSVQSLTGAAEGAAFVGRQSRGPCVDGDSDGFSGVSPATALRKSSVAVAALSEDGPRASPRVGRIAGDPGQNDATEGDQSEVEADRIKEGFQDW